jgi:hypothetical protein
VTVVTVVTQIPLYIHGAPDERYASAILAMVTLKGTVAMVNFLMVTEYDTRQKPAEVNWHGNIGYITIDGRLWGEVEWSKKRKVWCIQDAQGKCLSHTDHIHATTEGDKAAAVALALAMIRDGRMPDPRAAMQIRVNREGDLNSEQPVRRGLDWTGFF